MIGDSENVNAISNSLNMDISSLVNLRKKFSEVDILCIEETKIDPSYPDSQFHIDRYQFPPFCKDRNKHGGGKRVYVRNGIIAKRIKQFEEGCGETICLEFTFS